MMKIKVKDFRGEHTSMKLFVDDIRQAPDPSWRVVRTITDAISTLETFDFEVISLDHDISHGELNGDPERMVTCPENFTAVAYFLKAHYQDQIDIQNLNKNRAYQQKPNLPKIIIHSANPAGAMRIAGILKEFEVTIKEYGN